MQIMAFAPLANLTDHQIRIEHHGISPIVTALNTLVPGCQYVLRGHGYEDIEWSTQNTVPMPVREVLEAKVQEVIQQERARNSYVPQRIQAYPSIQQQLDMLYWDQVNGTHVWRDTIHNIKEQYPKPV